MKTTLDLPLDLIDAAMKLTHSKTKRELVIYALNNLIKQYKRNKLIDFHGEVDLDIDLDILRQR